MLLLLCRWSLLFLLLAVVWEGVCAEEDRSKWIDPHDMLNLGASLEEHEMEDLKNKAHMPEAESLAEGRTADGEGCKCEPQVQEVKVPCPECPECELCADQAAYPLLKQYITVLLDHVKDIKPSITAEDYNLHISLTPDNIVILEKFVATKNMQHIHDVHDILNGMINRVVVSRLTLLEKLALRMEETLGISLHRLIQFFSLAALASIVLLIEVRLQIPWRRRFSQLIVLMFFISIPWTWYDLYKQAQIKAQNVLNKPMPAECSDKDSWTMTLKSYLLLEQDKCLEYYEHAMVDPIVRVPPTKAIAVTVVRFIVAPLKDVGTALSEFMRALLVDLPVTLYPVALVFVIILVFMFLMMWFGYGVNVPFLLSIERTPQLTQNNAGLQQAIADSTQSTLTQLNQLQDRLLATETQLSDKLIHLERVQQTAIEYTMSSAPSSPAPSPSLPASVAASLPGVKVKSPPDPIPLSDQLNTSSDMASMQDVATVGAQGGN